MQISTQAVLNQDEMKTAITDFVQAQMGLVSNAQVTVEFEDDANGDLTAVVNISTGSASIEVKPAAKPRAKKPAAAAPAATEPEEESTGVQGAPSTDETAPWEPGEQEAAVTAVKDTAEAQLAAGASAAPRIFPNVASSAPVAAAAVEADATEKAKSLFANLKQPTH